MRIDRDPIIDSTTVVLSRRNLETLLAKLDGSPSDSACSIAAPAVYGRWIVKAEEDATHYDHPSREEARGIAGRMHPSTETAIGPPRVTIEGDEA